MLEIKKTAISFDEKDLMKLEEIEKGRKFRIRFIEQSSSGDLFWIPGV